MKLDVKFYEEKMKKSVASYEYELSLVRVGRASPAILAPITVDYYGCATPLAQVAEVKAADARTLSITPWDASLLKGIEKAILASDIGLTPQNDGKTIRLNFPPLTEEKRKAVSKDVAKLGEDAKVSIRNIRRDANDKCKDMKKKSEMTEDEQKTSEKQIQDLTDKYIKVVDGMTEEKTKSIMSL